MANKQSNFAPHELGIEEQIKSQNSRNMEMMNIRMEIG